MLSDDGPLDECQRQRQRKVDRIKLHLEVKSMGISGEMRL